MVGLEGALLVGRETPEGLVAGRFLTAGRCVEPFLVRFTVPVGRLVDLVRPTALRPWVPLAVPRVTFP